MADSKDLKDELLSLYKDGIKKTIKEYGKDRNITGWFIGGIIACFIAFLFFFCIIDWKENSFGLSVLTIISVLAIISAVTMIILLGIYHCRCKKSKCQNNDDYIRMLNHLLNVVQDLNMNEKKNSPNLDCSQELLGKLGEIVSAINSLQPQKQKTDGINGISEMIKMFERKIDNISSDVHNANLENWLIFLDLSQNTDYEIHIQKRERGSVPNIWI